MLRSGQLHVGARARPRAGARQIDSRAVTVLRAVRDRTLLVKEIGMARRNDTCTHMLDGAGRLQLNVNVAGNGANFVVIKPDGETTPDTIR